MLLMEGGARVPRHRGVLRSSGGTSTMSLRTGPRAPCADLWALFRSSHFYGKNCQSDNVSLLGKHVCWIVLLLGQKSRHTNMDELVRRFERATAPGEDRVLAGAVIASASSSGKSHAQNHRRFRKDQQDVSC